MYLSKRLLRVLQILRHQTDQFFEICRSFSYVISIGDIQLPAKVRESMQMQVGFYLIMLCGARKHTNFFFIFNLCLHFQVEAERKKRAAVLESEGERYI